MATFDAVGMVRIEGSGGARPAVGVAVAFARTGGPASTGRLPVGPLRVVTDKAGRWAQAGFDVRVTYAVHLTGQGLVFSPEAPHAGCIASRR